jgi:polyferredoxin
MKFTAFFRNALLIFIVAIFSLDIYRRLTDFAVFSQSYHQHALNAVFRSTFGVFELAMIGIMIYFIRNYPARRIRLLSLLFFHIVGVLVIPMMTRNFTTMAIFYPWPHTLTAFDHASPAIVLIVSLIMGFIIIPLITLKWGGKAFCGYVCPHGGFYSESFGRLFNPKPGKLKLLRKWGPPVYFILMLVALAAILLIPTTLDPIRTVQKQVFFLLSQVLYFVIGIPLVGARSYCTHFCPLGLEINWIVRWKNRMKIKNRSKGKNPT